MTSDSPGEAADRKLGAADLRAILHLIGSLHDAPNPTVVADALMTELGSVVPCDLISYNEINLEGGASTTYFEPRLVPRPQLEEAFARLLDQHPLVVDMARTGDPRPRRMSDFITLAELQSRDLYREVFRPLETNYQLGFSVATMPGGIVGIGLNRWRKDFDERDIAVVQALLPHLSAVFDHARLRAAAADTGLDEALGARLAMLTPRELQVLDLIRAAASNRTIARTLFISERTAEKHVANVLAKLGVATRVGALALFARRS